MPTEKEKIKEKISVYSPEGKLLIGNPVEPRCILCGKDCGMGVCGECFYEGYNF